METKVDDTDTTYVSDNESYYSNHSNEFYSDIDGGGTESIKSIQNKRVLPTLKTSKSNTIKSNTSKASLFDSLPSHISEKPFSARAAPSRPLSSYKHNTYSKNQTFQSHRSHSNDTTPHYTSHAFDFEKSKQVCFIYEYNLF